MKAPVKETLLTVIGLVITLVVAGIGLFMFFSRYQYAGPGHNYLVMGYVAACFVLFFGIRLWNIPLFVIAILALVGVQTYSNFKFDWREQYITNAQAGHPFPLEEFIENYPTFEEHLFKILKAPDWVRFNDDCVQPALLNKAMAGQCGSLDLITQYYNIDIKRTMTSYYGRMKSTAKQIQAGKLNKRSAYASCLASKSCATIPLLPKGVDANHIDPTGRDYIEIREAFWSIINDKHMTPEVCNTIQLCKALVTMKAVDIRRLPF